jgi:hypothetical protein
MTTIDIGIAVTALLLIMVLIGVRVAFAAALAGLTGLIWVFWSKKGYDPNQFFWALTVATKTAGQVPHSKVSSQALSLIPTFILIGYLAKQGEVGAAYREVMGYNFPAMTMVVVADLVEDQAKIEIEATAVLPN